MTPLAIGTLAASRCWRVARLHACPWGSSWESWASSLRLRRLAQGALAVLSADLYDVFSNYSLTVIPLFVSWARWRSTRHQPSASSRGELLDVARCAEAWRWRPWAPAPAFARSAAPARRRRRRWRRGTAGDARYRYDDALAAGTVAAGGAWACSSPSVVFIVYGILTEQSIGKLFIAGIVPGILVAILFCATISLVCRRNPNLAPATVSVSWRTRFRSLAGVLEMLVLFVFVMGGMFAGWFTPTEAAAIGAAGSVTIAAVGGHCSLRMLWTAAQETLRTSCMVMTIVAGATIFGHFLAVTGLPMQFAATLAGLPVPPWVVVALIIAFYLVAGCFIDSLALILLTVPIFHPVIQGFGYDPIWFGVMIVLVTQMGVITPPVGVNVYV